MIDHDITDWAGLRIPVRERRIGWIIVFCVALLLGALPQPVKAGVVLSKPWTAQYRSTAEGVFEVDASEACVDQERLLTRNNSDPMAQSKGFALLIGVDDVDAFLPLNGPANDVAILAAELSLRGYEIVKLMNPSRKEVFSAMQAVVKQARCRDFVFLSFSGHRVVLPGVFLAGEEVGTSGDQFHASGREVMLIHNENMSWALPSLTQESLERLRGSAALDVQAVDNLDEFAVMTEGLRASEDIIPTHVIAGFVLALAKKGVHTTVLSDAGNDELLHLASAFGYADFSTVTPFTRMVGQSGRTTPHNAVIDPGFYAGQQLFIYAAKQGAEAFETVFDVDGTEVIMGNVTHAFVTALRKSRNGSADEIYAGINRVLSSRDTALAHSPVDLAFVLESSSPAVPMFLKQDTVGPKLAGELDVTLEGLGETDTRGMIVLQKPDITFHGVVDDPRQLQMVIIDDQYFPAVNNRFQASLEISPNTKEITILAIFEGGGVARKTVPVFYGGAVGSALIKNPPYALLIANWQYEASGTSTVWKDLKSPPKDIELLGKILIEKFGFRTTIETPQGEMWSLILRNATRRDIERTFGVLEQSLGADDRLLIYYAGHGKYFNGQPFWVPVDGEDESHYSWVDADKLSFGLKSMRALSVLVISDSCFSGAFAGDTKSQAKLQSLVRQNLQNREEHRKSLLEYARHRSRQVITSGANSPVADVGSNTGGVSPFAYQLAGSLEALYEKYLSFSKDDLYYYVRTGVIGNNEKLKQTPLEGDLDEAGHDPEGSFVFIGISDPDSNAK